MTRTDLLNYLIDRYGYKTYLEIGIDTGVNFNRVNAQGAKVSIDPFCSASYVMTSDRYFETIGTKHLFDLIFIDGLHEEIQVIRDIENCLKILSPGGTIVVHDCNPKEERHQIEKRNGEQQWNGTVWKGWVRTRANHNDLDMYVLDMDEGCGVIQRKKSVDTKADFILIHELTWSWLVENRKHVLNLISFDKWKWRMGSKVMAGMFQYWDLNPPTEVLEWMNSWKTNHPNWDYQRFNEESARHYIKNELGSRELSAYDACLLPSSKSNVLRYCALYDMGGVWIDSDIECNGSIDGIWSGAKRGIVVREGRSVPGLPIPGYIKPTMGEVQIRNDFLLFKIPKDKLVERMLNVSLMNIKGSNGSTGTSYTLTGPGIWYDLYANNSKYYEGIDLMWYHDAKEWAYHEKTAYKKLAHHWSNVPKGTPIFSHDD